MALIVYDVADAPFIIANNKWPYDFCKRDLIIWCQASNEVLNNSC